MKKFLLLALLVLSKPVFAEKLLLTTSNVVTYRGPVDEDSATSVLLELTDLVRARGKAMYPIYLVLDSPGGSITAGLDFIEYAKTLENVHTVSLFAASMAAGIVEALPGKRYITNSGVLMFHRAKGSMQGQFEEGELESELAFFKTIVLGMENTNAARCGLSLADYKAKVKDEWWMYGSQAVAQKAVDANVELVCSDALVDKRVVGSLATFFGAFKVSYSGCPLLRSPIPNKNEKQEEKEQQE